MKKEKSRGLDNKTVEKEENLRGYGERKWKERKNEKKGGAKKKKGLKERRDG